MRLPAHDTMLGKIMRFPLACIPAGTKVRVLRGPLRGAKWIVGSGTNGCWLGTYESSQLRQFSAALNPGNVAYDIGANVGIYSLLASRRVGSAGYIYAFEPSERNLYFLRRHLILNRIENCLVIPAAVTEATGRRRFDSASWDPHMGRLSESGGSTVQALSLDSFTYSDQIVRPPTLMKIDVEGAELEVLRGGMRILEEHRPSIFLETHGDSLHSECKKFLGARGYVIEEQPGRIVASPRPIN
jgi:FkbM family methyltransferase